MRRSIFLLGVLALNLTGASRGLAQTWATNGPLNVGRWAHTATYLGNGKVLIAGGTIYNVSGNFADTNACELYDPGTGSSSAASSMADFRHSHTATLLNSGKVLVVGGSGGGTSELYDPGAGTWGQHISLAHERLAHTATLLQNGKVLVTAGYDDSSGNELSSCELYDPSSGTWNATGSLPYATDSAAAVMLQDGRVLVCGGSDGFGGAVTNAAIYNPNGGTWAVTGGLEEARATHKAVLLADGKVLVVGGNGGNTPEVFNPNTGTFTHGATMNDGWYSPNLVTLDDGRVMVCGDDNADVEVYDPNADAWNLIDPLIVPANQQTATKVAGGAVVVAGGSESTYNGPPIATIQTYGSTIAVPNLVVSNSPTTGGLPLTEHFFSPSVDSGGHAVTNWSWTFGDGGTSTNQSPTHTYTNLGDFSPSLTAQSAFGAQNLNVSGLQGVTVTNHSANASASPTTGFVPLTVQFTSPLVDSGGNTVTNWNWTFGDGGTSTNQNPSHIYNAVGTFNAGLTARSTYSSFPLDVFGPGSINTTNSPDPNFGVLHTFNNVDGSAPNAGLLLIGNSLYGTTALGGTNNAGIFYRVGLDGTGFTNLHIFNISQGGRPNGGLVTAGGIVFGTTYIGGSQSGGTVFAIRTNGTGITNLYEFKLNLPNTGDQPTAGLASGAGALFGTTQYGGSYDHGVLYTVTTNGANFQNLHAWNPTSGNGFVNYDGLNPVNQLLLVGPTLYGTALGGGSFTRGTVFAMETNSPGSFRILHYFPDVSGSNATNTDGGNPYGGLVLVSNTLYGTTVTGGKYGNGTVYGVSTDGLSFTNLHDFTGGNDGSSSHGGLVASGNTLYGCAQAGGTAGLGTLFSLRTDGSGFTSLFQFAGGLTGTSPNGDLLLTNNVLYGTAAGGTGDGLVFTYALTAPAPLLALAKVGTNVVLSWTNSPIGFALQATTNLGPSAIWDSVLPAPSLINNFNYVTNPVSPSRRFYRLIK